MYAYSTRVENLAGKKLVKKRERKVPAVYLVPFSMKPCVVFNEVVCMYCSARLGTPCQLDVLHGDGFRAGVMPRKGLLIGRGEDDMTLMD